MNDENDNDRVSELFSSLVEATKISQFLTTDDYSFYKLAHPDVGERLSKTGDKLLGLCNRLLGHTALPGANALQFENIDEVMDDFYPVVEIVDHLLEKADVCMDEVTGRNKQNAPNNFGIVAAIDTPTPRVQKNTNIIRPQLKFHDKIDNSNNTPYIRRITHKPNAKRPLDYGLPGSDQLSSEMAQHVKSLGITDASSSFYSLPHPYEYEIKNIDYPADTFEFIDEQMYGSLDDTPLHYIDKLEDFEMMLKKLEGQSHIAIDIEHHDYRSFIGFVCLIQISTRTEDFIIDALELRSHIYRLNETFTDPAIVKVLHGAEMDIIWLQRDFGVYIVNLFDTYHASNVLEMPSHGLAYLLQYYCNVFADKKYQRADWRMRPLPQGMINYARSDTHYLLYVYDRMRNEVLAKSNETHNHMGVVLERSESTALNLYEKEVYDTETGEGPKGWKNALRKLAGALSAEQFAVFKALHAWRDHTARREDESTLYVLPNPMLQRLAESMPTDAAAVIGMCVPTPPLVRINSVEIGRLIERVRNEARKSLADRQKELEQLKAEFLQRELEWEEKRKRGPVHTVFADAEDEATTRSIIDSPERATTARRMIVPVENDGLVDPQATFLPKNLRSNVKVTVASASLSIICEDTDMEDLEDGGKELRAKRVNEVLSSLKLLPPGLELLSSGKLRFVNEVKTGDEQEKSNETLTRTAADSQSNVAAVQVKKASESRKDEKQDSRYPQGTLQGLGKGKRATFAESLSETSIVRTKERSGSPKAVPEYDFSKTAKKSSVATMLEQVGTGNDQAANKRRKLAAELFGSGESKKRNSKKS